MRKPHRLVVDKSVGDTYGIKRVPGQVAPSTWADAINQIAAELTGKPPARLTLWSFLLPRAWFLCWGPSLPSLLAAAAGRELIYLCWGVPKLQGSGFVRRLKLLRLSTILSSARLVFVNDSKARDDVLALSGRTAAIVPYVVDCKYFFFAGSVDRRRFALVPGDNDRDEHLVRRLAARGIDVVRVTRTQRVLDWHKGLPALPTLQLKFRIAYGELAELYRAALVVCLPLSDDNHAAGQTTVLEALSSGAPVIISQGRMADEFKSTPSVFVCKTNDPAEWALTIESANQLLRRNPAIFEEASRHIGRTHDTKVVATRLLAQITASLCSPS